MVRAMVRLVKTKNCFINLPPHVARRVAGASEGAVILQLSWGAKGDSSTSSPRSWAFASWNGGLSDEQSGAIEVPLALARVVGLAAALDSDAYLSVQAEPAGYIPTASRVCLEPLSTDDWEILEANAEHLEGQMLKQVCVACTGQVMPIWVHNTSLIALQVVSVETPHGGGTDVACVRLTADTEVAVSPKPRRRRRLPEGRSRFRSSGLLRVAPPPRCWKTDAAPGCRGDGRPYLLVHPTTLAGIDGWNSSPSSRAPWPCPSPGKDDGSAVSAWTSPPPAEALAVLWRDGPSGPRCGDGEGAGSITAEGGGGGAAASFDGGVGGSGRGATSWRGGGSVGDLRTRETVSGVGNRSSPGDGRRNAVFPRRGGGTGEVVVILREDARVPLGHVADGAGEGLPAAGVAAAVAVAAAAKGGGRLCKRAGLSLLRRVARVRVLSAEESAAKLPRLVFSRVIPRNAPTTPYTPTSAAAASRTTASKHPVPGPAGTPAGAESASASFQEALRQTLSRALRGGAHAADGFGSCAPNNEGCGTGGVVDGEGAGLSEFASGGGGSPRTDVGGSRSYRRDPQRQDQRQRPSLLRSRSGSGLRQLVPSFDPLVLDEGIVVSLGLPPPLSSSCAQSSRRYTDRSEDNDNGNSCATGRRRLASQPQPFPDDTAVTGDFVVGFSTSDKKAGIAGFPLPVQTELSGEGGHTGVAAGAAARVAYAVLACQEDVDDAVAGALIGGDIFAPDLRGEAVAREEKNEGGIASGVVVLGGVERQMRAASNMLAPVLVRSIAAARARLGVAAAAGGVVVHGASGAGKTALALATARRVRESHLSMAGTVVVSCRDLQGRKMADVLGALEEAFFSASRHAPSLVILDDLDKIAPVEGDDGVGAFNAQSARIAERLEDLLTEAGETAAVGVLATAASVAALHPSLTRSGLLDAQVEIPPPAPAARALILRSLVRELGGSSATACHKGQTRETSELDDIYGNEDEKEEREEEDNEEEEDDGGIDWEYLSSKTEGCQARDLAKLVKRALLHSALRRMKEAEAETDRGTTTTTTAVTPFLPGHDRRHQQSLHHSEAAAPPPPPPLPPLGVEARKLPGVVDCGDHGKSAAAASDAGRRERISNGNHAGRAPRVIDCDTMSSAVVEGLPALDARDTGSDGPRVPVVVAPGGAGQREGDIGIEMEDLEAALKGFSAESLRGAGLFRSSVEWADVGGLRGVRAELREILELPVKYGRLFEATPTRLPTGALLYGPPGCGKTLLAGAVAAECGLNFISVKGPEVLDKYIGASEQAVRSLFARAASAAPCVLFFDEFEAVAPRRGNDNTGVTDRVVNQLLTFLDGVEGRNGVYVLGATSRPDLIDSALLRPGRLDRQLYCGFPDEAEREDILRAVCRKTPMSEEAREVALARVARSPKAQAFTGADLQAIVDTAQLTAIHSYLEAAQSPETEEAPAVEENGGDVGGGGSSGQGAGVVVDGSNTRKINGSTRRLSALPPETQPFTEVATTLGDGGKGELAKTANGNRIDTSSTANQLVRFEGGNGLHPQSNGGGVNSSNIDHPASRRRNAGREGKNTTRGVEVSADDVWEAFLSTRPSLSSEDRARYDSAYQKFRGGSRPADFNPVSSVDDGTLRTALK